MLEKLQRNKLFKYLLPLICLAALFAAQRLLYEPYLNGVLWKLILCYAAAGVCLVAFFFWLVIVVKEKTPSIKFLALFIIIAGLAGLGLYVGIGAAVSALTTRSFAFIISSGFMDAAVLIAYGYALAKIKMFSGKKPVSILAAAALILVIGFLSAFSGISGLSGTSTVVKDFAVRNCLADGGNKPVKVVLLAGQSNASGVSSVDYLSRTAESDDFARYSAGYDNVYINFFDDNGINSSNGYFVPATLGQGCQPSYFGPEVGLSDTLSAAYPDETVFVIKYAWGGTNLYDQWLSPSSDGDTGELYTAFVSFVTASMDYLLAKNYDAEIVAMCWMQGESDADDKHCGLYQTNTENFAGDLRSAFADYTAISGMLFVDAGISDSVYWKNYTVINDAKRAYAETSPLNVYLDTISAGLTVTGEPEGNPDLAHYDSLSEILLGKLFAEAIVSYCSD